MIALNQVSVELEDREPVLKSQKGAVLGRGHRWEWEAGGLGRVVLHSGGLEVMRPIWVPFVWASTGPQMVGCGVLKRSAFQQTGPEIRVTNRRGLG